MRGWRQASIDSLGRRFADVNNALFDIFVALCLRSRSHWHVTLIEGSDHWLAIVIIKHQEILANHFLTSCLNTHFRAHTIEQKGQSDINTREAGRAVEQHQ
jgi:hypothetical protein